MNTATRKKKEIKPVKGTFAIHSVVTDGQNNTLYVRDTTCACTECFGKDGFNGDSICMWEKRILRIDPKKQVSTDDAISVSVSTVNENISLQVERMRAGALRKAETVKGEKSIAKGSICIRNENEKSENKCKFEVSDFIVGRYEEKCYIGQILAIDNTDDEIHVNFMEETKSAKSFARFKWPTNPDKIWIPKHDALRKIDPPIATGKGRRIFQVANEVIDLMECNHTSLK